LARRTDHVTLPQLSEMRPAELFAYSRFVAAIPALVRERVTLDDARRIVRERLATREERFLALVGRAVFGNARSPYLPLLRRAGCQAGDLARAVRADGLEATLRRLRAEGVYVSFDELKGRQPIVRPGLTLGVEAHDFDNPLARRYLPGASGGSTGPRTRVLFDADHLRTKVPAQMVLQDAHGVSHAPRALWRAIPPSLIGVGSSLAGVLAGNPVRRWFSHVWYDEAGGFPARAAVSAIRASARLGGARLPAPEHVPFARAGVLVDWLRECLAREGGGVINSSVSNLVRVAEAAVAAGVDLTGAVLSGGGEPPTRSKVDAIERSGARHLAGYSFAEGGAVGLACAAPLEENDHHFAADGLALIQHPHQVGDVEVPAFHFTSLHATTPKVLLNAESDDFGVVEERRCGCALEALGYSTHVRRIRSYRKLTGEGMTLVGTDMERILGELLPARFGGGSLDYQLLEEETPTGRSKLALLVDPRVELRGSAAEVVAAVYDALAAGGGSAQLASAVWRQAGTLELRRETPRSSPMGKLLPLATLGLGALGAPSGRRGG
jgi:hypothetical protein